MELNKGILGALTNPLANIICSRPVVNLIQTYTLVKANLIIVR